MGVDIGVGVLLGVYLVVEDPVLVAPVVRDVPDVAVVEVELEELS